MSTSLPVVAAASGDDTKKPMLDELQPQAVAEAKPPITEYAPSSITMVHGYNVDCVMRSEPIAQPKPDPMTIILDEDRRGKLTKPTHVETGQSGQVKSVKQGTNWRP